jgi:hypothetical protein
MSDMPSSKPVPQKYLKCEVAACDRRAVSHIIYIGRCDEHAGADGVAVDETRWMIMGR